MYLTTDRGGDGHALHALHVLRASNDGRIARNGEDRARNSAARARRQKNSEAGIEDNVESCMRSRGKLGKTIRRNTPIASQWLQSNPVGRWCGQFSSSLSRTSDAHNGSITYAMMKQSPDSLIYLLRPQTAPHSYA